jgi:hypothetical protein
VFYYTVELSSQASAFFFTFIEVGPHISTASKYGISALPEYNILPGPPLVGGVHIGLIFRRGWFVFFEPWEFLELLRGCFPCFRAGLELIIGF